MNKIISQKTNNESGQTVYEFYILKTIKWAEPASFSGPEAQGFSILSGKRYEITPNYEIFLTVQSDETLELRFNQPGVKQKNYQFTKISVDWWVGVVTAREIDQLITNDFCHRTLLSHRSGKELEKAGFSYWEGGVYE